LQFNQHLAEGGILYLQPMKLAQKLALNYIRAKLNIIAVVSKKKAAKKAFQLFCTPFRKQKKHNPPVFNKGEKLSFELDGLTIRGQRWNHHHTQKVLIIHGFESNSKNFDRYIVPLIRNGYEVVAFDAPAHGKSDGKQLNLPLYVKTIRQVYHLYGPFQSYLSHSFGGLALSHFLETIPTDGTIKSVLIAPATETTSAIDSFFRMVDLDEEVRKEFDKIIYDKGGVWPEHYSIRRAMKNIHSSVLWFHDEEDDVTPISDVLKLKEENPPNIEFIFTKGLGHRRIYRDNKVVKRILDFLGLPVDKLIE